MGWGWGGCVQKSATVARKLNRWRLPLNFAMVYVGRSLFFTANADHIVDTAHCQCSERAKPHFHADHITSKALDPWRERVVCYTFA